MKALLLIVLTFSTLNVFAAELGEDQKGECIYANQSANRDAKIVIEDGSASEGEKPVSSSIKK